MYLFIILNTIEPQGPGYLALQEEEDSSLNQAAIEALPAPPG